MAALISTGKTASMLKAKENGVSLVDLRYDVLMTDSASGSISSQSPLAAPSFFFNDFLMILLMPSNCSLDCGCAGEAKKTLILNHEQRCRKREESNWVSLSVTMAWGMPNRRMMFFHMKLSILVAVIVARGSASTHLVK